MFRRKPQTATEWLVRLNAGALTPGDRRGLMRWLASDPERLKELVAAQAVNRMAAGLVDSAVARALLADDLQSYFGAQPAKGKSTLFPLGVAAVAACAAALLFVLMPGDTSSLPRLKNHGDAHTVTGQIASYVLPDKSQITKAA
ncbi:MAG: FecR/PupR family sigma factor regulator, partial [Rhodospirillaceae bacterium]